MTQFTCKGVKQINNRISLNMTFTFTIHISQRFSSAQEFQMGNFQKYWSQNVGQDFFVAYLNFFTGGRFWKLTGGTLKIGRKMLPPEGSHVWLLYELSFHNWINFNIIFLNQAIIQWPITYFLLLRSVYKGIFIYVWTSRYQFILIPTLGNIYWINLQYNNEAFAYFCFQ